MAIADNYDMGIRLAGAGRAHSGRSERRRWVTALVAGLVAAGLVPIAAAPVASAAAPTFTQLASGYGHSCAVLSDGHAACWGSRGSEGRIGDGLTDVDAPVPTLVTSTGPLAGKTVKQVAAGAYHSCALTTDGNAACWGANGSNQLGNGSTASSSVPVAVQKTGALAGTEITQISGGVYSSCGVFSGVAACWGTDNTYGQVGTGVTTVGPHPVITAGTPLAGKTIKYVGVGNVECVRARHRQHDGVLGDYRGSADSGTVPSSPGTADRRSRSPSR